MNKKPTKKKSPATAAEQRKAEIKPCLERSLLPQGSGRALNVRHRAWAIHQKPDWEFWLNMPEVELWQACALSLNVNPDSIAPTNNGMGGESFFKEPSFPNEEIWEAFHKRRRLLKANMQQQHSYDSHSIGLGDFVRLILCLSSPWDMPQELVALAQKPEVQTNVPTTEPPLSTIKETSDSEAAKLEIEIGDVQPNTELMPDEQSELEICNLFDLMNKKAIALLFDRISESDWLNKYFNRASRNGLKEIREERKYNPVKVAKWLVRKGFYTRLHANSKLAGNLPGRSKDKKYLITGDLE